MNRIKVALGLSGGVDSAVSAYLLKENGYDVHCVYLNCYDGDTPGCRGDNDRKDALAVAMQLGLPFQVLDFRRQYKAAVIDYFKKEYLLGRTPNPDVVCNREIKFGLFLDWAIKSHFDAIATGHYAKLDGRGWKIEDGGGRLKMEDGKAKADRSILDPLSSTTTFHHLSSTVNLIQPKDLHKDQTYFLWAVPGEKFKRVLFPLGDLLKTEVREIANRLAPLSGVAEKKDSTGICFVGEVKVEDFLKKLGVKEKEGEVVIRTTIDNSGKLDDRRLKIEDGDGKWKVEGGKSRNGQSIFNHLSSTTIIHHPSSIVHFKIIGSHRGVWFYTIGQRHGFSTDPWSSKNKDRPPLYVIAKDIKTNRLIVGFGPKTYRDNFKVSDCNWLTSTKDSPSGSGRTVLCRIRHLGDLIPCQLSVVSCQLSVALAMPARGIAPGQSAVFYSKEGIVLGGGIIQ